MRDPALVAGVQVRLALQEPIRVADRAVREGEAVQHRKTIEPVPNLLRPDLEESGAVADEDSLEPFGEASEHVEARVAYFARQRREAEGHPASNLTLGSFSAQE